MASSRWSSPGSVGLSKKHDVPYSARHNVFAKPSWSTFRRRRILLTLISITGLFFFFKYIPTDVPPVSQRYNPTFGNMAPSHVQSHMNSQEGQDTHRAENIGQQYEGSIMLPNLGASLRPHIHQFSFNVVLFAFSDLTSTSNLIPLACQMAQHNRSSVHVALLGRQDISTNNLMSISGIAMADCPVFWHDARPDQLLESTDSRIEASIQMGFEQICDAIRPQVILVDAGLDKDSDHVKLFRVVAADKGLPLVLLPSDAQQALTWITALDSSSLQKLNEIEIEIVIQAYVESAGSLIRLLRSIENADYNGLFFPRITVELPPRISPFVTRYLEQIRWPPASVPAESRLTLRHRIHTRTAKAHEATLRTIESFYPRISGTSHVLLLSPDAELSPFYLHYLMFTLLEYKHSLEHKDFVASLLGISLELPDRTIDGLQPFVDHTISDKLPFVLSQTSNSDAALIMGDKWIELHSFLANRLERDPNLAQAPESTTSLKEKYPRWLMEMLDLMQARGLYMLYPSFAIEKDVKLVTLHEDLLHAPEEFPHLDVNGDPPSPDINSILHNDVLTGDKHRPTVNDHAPMFTTSLPLQRLLSDLDKGSKRALPYLADMPLFTVDGKLTSWTASQIAAEDFSADFALKRGGCASPEARVKAELGLFCDSG